MCFQLLRVGDARERTDQAGVRDVKFRSLHKPLASSTESHALSVSWRTPQTASTGNLFERSLSFAVSALGIMLR
jgi:hypothetical protein